MKPVGKFIDKIDKNHDKYVPRMILLIIFLALVAWFTFPSYTEYCKTAEHKCENK